MKIGKFEHKERIMVLLRRQACTLASAVLIALIVPHFGAAQTQPHNPPPLPAKDIRPLLWDTQLSIPVGVASMQSTSDAFNVALDRLLPRRLSDENTFPSKLGGISYRLAKLTFIEWPLDQLHDLVLHEFFGHGTRGREFGWDASSYNLGPPRPYGDGIGNARFEPPFERYDDLNALSELLNNSASVTELLAVHSGGYEATLLALDRLWANWISRRRFDYRDAFYVSRSLMVSVANMAGGLPFDGALYIATLDTVYASQQGRSIDAGAIEDRVSLNFVNPLWFYAVYQTIVGFLGSGRGEFGVPMLSFGANVKYLPWLRYTFTPFGPEYGVQQIALVQDRTVRLGLRLGDVTVERMFGLGIGVWPITHSKAVSVGARLEIWDQPGFELLGDNAGSRDGGFGGAVLATVFVPLSEQRLGSFGLAAEVGYKTAGFVEGEALDSGVILRVGAAIALQ